MDLYKKDFIFKTSYFEEIVVGGGRRSANSDVVINGEMITPDAIHFTLTGILPSGIAQIFVLPVLGALNGDVLPDRIMYGRLPQYEVNVRPMIPVVCEVFNDMKTIRFALQGPLRIIEFHGNFIG